MDTLAHGLWGNIIVYKKYPQNPKMRWIAVAFGMLPDLIPFAPLFIYTIFTGRFGGPENWNFSHWTLNWAPEAYNYTHSLVIFAFTGFCVALYRKIKYKAQGFNLIYFPMLAWGFHILLDIPTHPNFYNTPFLFPLSDYKITWGLSWGHPIILIPQYVFFAVWYSWRFLKGRKSADPNLQIKSK